MNKEFSSKIATIIPVHYLDDTVKKLLEKAINSVPNEVLINVVCPQEILTEISALKVLNNKDKKYTIINANDKSNFAELVNQGVNALGDNIEYFSILEFDDEYNKNWFDNVEKYVEYYPETSVFMPIVEVVNYSNDKFIGYANEAPWASSFSEEIGYIDNSSLQDYYDYNLTGSFFNLKDWNNVGGLKESIKLSFWYEFLLRCMNEGKKVYVIPKTGYKHVVNRDNSLYEIYSKTITNDESLWWFNLAKTECFHKADRKKEYVKPEN